jgi:hypothetical protein
VSIKVKKGRAMSAKAERSDAKTFKGYVRFEFNIFNNHIKLHFW